MTVNIPFEHPEGASDEEINAAADKAAADWAERQANKMLDDAFKNWK